MDVESIYEKMRAKEFISEATSGHLSKRQQEPSRGIHKFTDAERWNSDYKFYRMGLALACTDGESMPETDFESFVGRWKMAYPYSQVEVDMLKRAYEATKTAFVDLNNGDLMSKELPDTNVQSPVSNWMKK
jgi:hypothetical protein